MGTHPYSSLCKNQNYARHKHEVIIDTPLEFSGGTKNCIEAKPYKILTTLFNKTSNLH